MIHHADKFDRDLIEQAAYGLSQAGVRLADAEAAYGSGDSYLIDEFHEFYGMGLDRARREFTKAETLWRRTVKERLTPTASV